MELRDLKRLRRVVSVGVAVLSGVLFLDLGGLIPAQVTSAVASFQLVPALLKTLRVTGLWTVGFGFIVLLTLAFGRVYCSTVCPLGTFQDIFIYIARRIARRKHRRRWYEFSTPHYAVHYGLLALTGVLAAVGSFFLLNLVEPFSNFGRMTANLVRPLVAGGNNILASLLGHLNIYVLSRFPVHGLPVDVILGTLLFFAVVAYLSYTRGRIFCNLLCPAGALLGLVSRASLYRIVIDETTCTDCGLCEKVCKAECIDSAAKKVEFAACVSCFNCIDACPTVGLKYEGLTGKRGVKREEKADAGRRAVLKASALPLLLVAGGVPDTSVVAPGLSRSKGPVSPPGSVDVSRFTGLCTACHLCVSVCPTQVLAPTFLEYGMTGIFQPRMDYRINYCTYECVLCSTVCPTGAILPLTLEAKKEVQIGKVQFVKDDCIVVAKKKDCGACAEHCPTKAVTMVPYEGKLTIPQTKDEICVGCGACEHACPTVPNKAIYVEANQAHQRAKKPEVKKVEPPPDTGGAFPF